MGLRKLILLIGRGPLEKKNDISTYINAKYCFPEDRDNIVETPFVGEAIIRLQKEEFDEVHILGTRDAMWDVLFLHCVSDFKGKDKKDAKKESKRLTKLREAGELTPNDIQGVADAFSSYLGIKKTIAHIISLGIDVEDFWSIFEILSQKIELEGHRISFDITHSVRSHPIFFIFSLFFLNSVVEDVQIESFYYGALALSHQSEYAGKTPILNINTYIELMKWIDAAQAFKRYVDTVPIANLLDEQGGFDSLKEIMLDFSLAMQLNLTESVKNTGRKLVEQLDQLSDDTPRPLLILKEHFATLPKQMSNKTYDWRSILHLAHYHSEHSRLGLSVLCLSEAITYRFAEIFHKHGRIRHGLAWAVMAWSNAHDSRTNRRQQFMKNVTFGNDFLNNYDKLKSIRDAIAHEVPLGAGLGGVIKDLLDYFQISLPSQQLEYIEKIYNPDDHIKK